jgi:hypothetical protein
LIDLGTDVSVILIGRLGNRAEDLDWIHVLRMRFSDESEHCDEFSGSIKETEFSFIILTP